MRDATEAEDLAQNVFIQVHKSAKRYKASAKFSTWLFTIARNLCLNELRRRARHPADSLYAPAHADTDDPRGHAVEDRRVAAAPRDEAVATAEAQQHAAAADVERTKVTLDRTRELFKQQLAPAQSMDEARTANEAAQARMESLDMLANNMANSGTAGFKADQEFYSVFRDELPIVDSRWTDFSQGTVMPTGNPLDLSLEGKGFFALNSPAGVVYSRGGSFRISGAGQLSTAEGYTLRNTRNNGQPIVVDPAQPFTGGEDHPKVGIGHQSRLLAKIARNRRISI